MAILIEGIEMPKEGRITIQIGADGAVYIVLSCKITAEKYEEKYSVIEVQEPHGRLGDLDELAKQIEHDRYHHTHTDGLAVRHHIAEYGHFLNAISEAPTIIPASEEE